MIEGGSGGDFYLITKAPLTFMELFKRIESSGIEITHFDGYTTLIFSLKENKNELPSTPETAV